MSLIPDPWWLSCLLGAALLFDVIVSLRPPRFISDCLEGVRFPRDWWWALVVVKACAVVGLIAGLWVPGVGLAAHAGVIVYFLCAIAAHLRARFPGRACWVELPGNVRPCSRHPGLRLPDLGTVHSDVDDFSAAVAVEEPGDSPWFFSEWMHDLQPGRADSIQRFGHVVYEDRNRRVHRGGGVGGHQTELMSFIVAKRDNPAMVHEHV